MGAEADVKRYRAAVADLQKKVSQESKKVADARKKAASARQAAQRTSSGATAASKLREADREDDRAARAEAERAKLEARLADRTKDLHNAEAKLSKERDVAQERRMRALDQSIRRSEAQFRPTWPPRSSPVPDLGGTVALAPTYDLFVSHASEDKDEIARPLVEALKERGLTVWFDEQTLRVGDSLRRKIDEGLKQSRFGVVILSPHFFEKEWPQVELDGLTAKATASGETVILPIWHHLSKDDVLSRSPTLAGVMALNTSVMTIGEIADSLRSRVLPDH
jgi:hypothetical protein